MILTSILLQAAEGGAKSGGSSMIWMLLILVVMWILMIRPQRKQAKEEQKFRENIQKGDRILFSGGIYGKIHAVAETTVEVEVANGTILTVEKSMVQKVPETKEK